MHVRTLNFNSTAPQLAPSTDVEFEQPVLILPYKLEIVDSLDSHRSVEVAATLVLLRAHGVRRAIGSRRLLRKVIAATRFRAGVSSDPRAPAISGCG